MRLKVNKIQVSAKNIRTKIIYEINVDNFC